MTRFTGDCRAVSVTVGYVLMLVVATLLLGTLVTAAGGLIEQQSEAVIDDELTVIGNQLASNLHEADRLAQVAHRDANATASGGAGRVVLDVRLPQRVAGSGYLIEVDGGTITLNTSNPDVSVVVGYPETVVPVDAGGQFSGGDVRVVYEVTDPSGPPSAGRLEVNL